MNLTTKTKPSTIRWAATMHSAEELSLFWAKEAGHSWARSEPLERQKRHQQVHFHLLIKANWLLNKGHKNGPLIFGETPGKSTIFFGGGFASREKGLKGC